VVVRHYRTHKENWAGGFSRNAAEDDIVLAGNPLPADTIELVGFRVNGHEVSYNGRLTMAFRMNDRKELIAFEGENCKEVTIDGRKYQFADSPLQKIAFAPSLDESKKELKVLVRGKGTVSIPLTEKMNPQKLRMVGNQGKPIHFKITNKSIQFDADQLTAHKWMTIQW
jgi:hypothetical protein